jgi:hypothetical protein
MIQLLSLRALRLTYEGVGTAISAAREYRHASAVRRGEARAVNPLTAGIPL